MHSYIIFSGTEKIRENVILKFIRLKLGGLTAKEGGLANIADPDITVLTPHPSIQIEDVRSLKQVLSLKPVYRDQKIIIFRSADKLTLPAQHALLKTLEEPSPRTLLILELQNLNTLLPTIRSRCQVIEADQGLKPIQKKADQENIRMLTAFINGSPGERLKFVKNVASREQAEALTRSLLDILHRRMLRNPKWYKAVWAAQDALIALEGNANPKLTVEHLTLNLPPASEEDSP